MHMTTTEASVGSADVRQQRFIDLYQGAFPAVARFVRRSGGSLEMAQDIFQDTLVIYYEKTMTQATEPPPDRQRAYLLGIARHLWIRKYHRTRSEVPLETADVSTWTNEGQETPSRQRLLRFLTVAGKKCMDLLRAFYYDQCPLDEVANTFGYSGVRSATVQKYKCLEKVRNVIKEKSLQYEDFLEENETMG